MQHLARCGDVCRFKGLIQPVIFKQTYGIWEVFAYGEQDCPEGAFSAASGTERIMELITAYPEIKAILPLKRLPKQVRAFTARTVRK